MLIPFTSKLSDSVYLMLIMFEVLILVCIIELIIEFYKCWELHKPASLDAVVNTPSILCGGLEFFL